MTKRNGSPPSESESRSGRLTRVGLAPEVEAMLTRRTQGFQRATAGKGLPVTWGKGDGPRKGFEPKATRRK